MSTWGGSAGTRTEQGRQRLDCTLSPAYAVLTNPQSSPGVATFLALTPTPPPSAGLSSFFLSGLADPTMLNRAVWSAGVVLLAVVGLVIAAGVGADAFLVGVASGAGAGACACTGRGEVGGGGEVLVAAGAKKTSDAFGDVSPGEGDALDRERDDEVRMAERRLRLIRGHERSERAEQWLLCGDSRGGGDATIRGLKARGVLTMLARAVAVAAAGSIALGTKLAWFDGSQPLRINNTHHLASGTMPVNLPAPVINLLGLLRPRLLRPDLKAASE